MHALNPVLWCCCSCCSVRMRYDAGLVYAVNPELILREAGAGGSPRALWLSDLPCFSFPGDSLTWRKPEWCGGRPLPASARRRFGAAWDAGGPQQRCRACCCGLGSETRDGARASWEELGVPDVVWRPGDQVFTGDRFWIANSDMHADTDTDAGWGLVGLLKREVELLRDEARAGPSLAVEPTYEVRALYGREQCVRWIKCEGMPLDEDDDEDEEDEDESPVESREASFGGSSAGGQLTAPSTPS